jgi:hypothetical protein
MLSPLFWRTPATGRLAGNLRELGKELVRAGDA